MSFLLTLGREAPLWLGGMCLGAPVVGRGLATVGGGGEMTAFVL